MPYITGLYLPLVDSQSGDFRGFPFPGSLVEQPHCTMEILKVIQLEFKKAIKDSMERSKR